MTHPDTFYSWHIMKDLLQSIRDGFLILDPCAVTACCQVFCFFFFTFLINNNSRTKTTKVAYEPKNTRFTHTPQSAKGLTTPKILHLAVLYIHLCTCLVFKHSRGLKRHFYSNIKKLVWFYEGGRGQSGGKNSVTLWSGIQCCLFLASQGDSDFRERRIISPGGRK